MDSTVTISALGALVGLILSIVLLFKKVPPFYALFIGALFGGLITGIISNSTLGDSLISLIDMLGLPTFLLAPLSGILMSAATASTTSGSAVVSSVFGQTLLNSGVSAIGGAAMIQSGATVLDHLPHGSFFHATGGSINMAFKERLQIIPYESAIGLVLTIVSTIIFGLLGIGG